jgi:Contact-dependent growth inhibition CdiA C-terminal domain
MGSNAGSIVIPFGVNVWPHELKTADALAGAGKVVEFLVDSKSENLKSPDIRIGSTMWEIKSPKTDKLSSIERNLKKASKQSPNIIIDSIRIKGISDSAVQKFLVQKYTQQKNIKKLVFVDRKRRVIDIGLLT